MRLYAIEVASPVGLLTVTASDEAVVGLRLPGTSHPVFEAARGMGHRLLERARAELEGYFEGRRRSFDLPLAPRGTDFEREVWRALLEIPFGETRSDGQLARSLRRERAARAVGAANAKNPISILVPCHRVVGSDGSLTGYAGGTGMKSWLLDHESKVAGRAVSRQPELFR